MKTIPAIMSPFSEDWLLFMGKCFFFKASYLCLRGLMWYIFPFILTTSTFNRLKVQLNQLWPASFRQPHYLIVPPACGMCGRARRSDPAGGCFRRVWLLPGGSGTHNVPARERPLQGGPECRPLVAVNELLQTDADKAEKCLVKFCLYLPPPPPPPPPGKPLHMEPFTGPAVNRSPCRKKKGKTERKEKLVHTQALSSLAASGNLSEKLTEKFFWA